MEDAVIFYSAGKYSDTSTSEEDGSFSVGPLVQWHYLIYLGSPGHYPDGLAFMVAGGLSTYITVKADNYCENKVSIGMRNYFGLKIPPEEHFDFNWDENIEIRLMPLNRKSKTRVE